MQNLDQNCGPLSEITVWYTVMGKGALVRATIVSLEVSSFPEITIKLTVMRYDLLFNVKRSCATMDQGLLGTSVVIYSSFYCLIA